MPLPDPLHFRHQQRWEPPWDRRSTLTYDEPEAIRPDELNIGWVQFLRQFGMETWEVRDVAMTERHPEPPEHSEAIGYLVTLPDGRQHWLYVYSVSDQALGVNLPEPEPVLAADPHEDEDEDPDPDDFPEDG